MMTMMAMTVTMGVGNWTGMMTNWNLNDDDRHDDGIIIDN